MNANIWKRIRKACLGEIPTVKPLWCGLPSRWRSLWKGGIQISHWCPDKLNWKMFSLYQWSCLPWRRRLLGFLSHSWQSLQQYPLNSSRLGCARNSHREWRHLDMATRRIPVSRPPGHTRIWEQVLRDMQMKTTSHLRMWRLYHFMASWSHWFSDLLEQLCSTSLKESFLL